MLSVLDVSASALEAERIHMNTIAQNVANAYTTRDSLGRPIPYRRKEVLFAPERTPDGQPGVRVVDIVEDPSPYRRVWDPDHPDAVNGYVRYPNVNVIQEMVDLIMASRAYEANVTVMELTKSMAAATLKLLA